jgi:hypothetical protein
MASQKKQQNDFVVLQGRIFRSIYFHGLTYRGTYRGSIVGVAGKSASHAREDTALGGDKKYYDYDDFDFSTAVEKPEGDGDYDGKVFSHLDEAFRHIGRATYRGVWRDGVPSGMGWWNYEGTVYAGGVAGDRASGHGALWWGHGQQCFEGEWDAFGCFCPRGEGIMLYTNGELWRVRFDGNVSLFPDVYGWREAQKVALLGRVQTSGQLPKARPEERGALPEWTATLTLPDGRIVRRRLRGLTQVRRVNVCG